jgi:HEAT repeat protein
MPRLSFFVFGAFFGVGLGARPSADAARPLSATGPGSAIAPSRQEEIRNVTGLLAAVRDIPPVVCGLTAEAASGWGGRGWYDAPSTPLGQETAMRVAYFPRGALRLSEIALLVDSLASPIACVRELSVRLIGRVDAEIVEDRLIERVNRGDSTTREAAALGLGLVRSKKGVETLIRSAGDADNGVRGNSVWALGRIGDGRAPVAATVREALRDDESDVRTAAAAALGQLEVEDAVEELLRVLRSDPEPRVRRAAAWALGHMRRREAVDGLAAALRSERDEETREMCVWALGHLEAASAATTLSELVRRDSSAEVREAAAWALGQIESRDAVAALGEAAGGDSNDGVRGTAAWALGQIQPSEAPAGLIRAVADARDHVRTKAAWAISEIGDARAVTPLREALRKEENKSARRAQLRALLKSGERSEEFFKELLQSEDASVREAAVRGIAGRGMNPWPWPMPRPRPYP